MQKFKYGLFSEKKNRSQKYYYDKYRQSNNLFNNKNQIYTDIIFNDRMNIGQDMDVYEDIDLGEIESDAADVDQ